jgi:tetratricopeptide (TPR) repeat protein
LLEAVGYFDSIDDGFLAARAHYINGVGFYERGDVVNSCAEYLKTLEVMEEHFEEQELVGHKARFLAYTYNRLGDLFSEQFMMESAITCYENALVYCKIEPTSPTGVSNILYRIGKQYDKKKEEEKNMCSYDIALDDTLVNKIRPAFTDNDAIAKWMQQQVEAMVLQLATSMEHSKEKTPLSKRLRGVVKAPKDFDYKVELANR